MIRWEAALFTALWAAGVGLVLTTWLLRLSEWWRDRRRRVALFGSGEALRRRAAAIRELPPLRRLAEEMEIAGVRLPVEALVGAALFVGVAAWFLSQASVVGLQQRYALDADRLTAANPWLVHTAVAGLLGSVPVFYVKFRLQRKRHRIALDMIKLVQNVIGHYQTGRTVQDMITRAAATMPAYVRDEWKRLEVDAHMNASLEESLYTFAERADNAWAQDLADILLIKHKYGNDVVDALHKLVVDMQIARRDEERRLAMVTVYRIGTSVMAAFAFFIIFFNVYADGANYRHYFLSSTGKLLLLASAVVMFVSMALVVRSGRRTF
ncbi:type II secretion system F family protein [Paenibacillus sp. TRM 82003]|nr:type II secretion system F family protein [Paenibacillus sp. TRM 82003]